MRGDDRFRREMHQQLSEASLVELYEWSYRTAVPGQCFGGSSAFSSGKIADGLAAKARLASKLGQFAVERASGTAESIVKCLLGQIAYESAMKCRIGMAGLSAGRNCP